MGNYTASNLTNIAANLFYIYRVDPDLYLEYGSISGSTKVLKTDPIWILILNLTVYILSCRETYSLDSHWQTKDVIEMIFKDRLKASLLNFIIKHPWR